MANIVAMNRLKDGVIAGFRLSEVKSYQQEVDVQNPSTGMIDAIQWTKIQVKLTHDAFQQMSQKDPYAVASVDPARPLVLTLHTYLIPQHPVDGVPQAPRPADKAPSSDKQRWAFIKYDTVQKILRHAGYIKARDLKAQNKPAQKYPLPGVVYIELALSGGNNYPRHIGGPEIVDEKRKAMDEVSDALDSICELGENVASAENDTLDDMPDDVPVDNQGQPSDEEKEIVKQETGKKSKK